MRITKEDIDAMSYEEKRKPLDMLRESFEEEYTDDEPQETEEELQILQERLEEYRKDPSTAIPWEEAYKQLKKNMTNKLVISSRVLHDVEKIRDWYDERSYQAGRKFLDELNSFLTKLVELNKEVRRCLMNTFPYIIYFSDSGSVITILRVRHSK